MNPEILIVGQGLAGTTLALQLHRSGIPFLVVDNPNISRSSRVAAGLFNPVVFKRMNLGWRTHDCLKEAISFYRFVEQLTESSFCHANGMHRIHGSVDERKLWEERLLELGWEHHIEDTLPAENHPWLNQPFDGARVNSAGYIYTLEIGSKTSIYSSKQPFNMKHFELLSQCFNGKTTNSTKWFFVKVLN